MKTLFIILVVLVVLTAFSLGFLKGATVIDADRARMVNQLDAENQNLQYQLKQCMILYRGQ